MMKFTNTTSDRCFLILLVLDLDIHVDFYELLQI